MGTSRFKCNVYQPYFVSFGLSGRKCQESEGCLKLATFGLQQREKHHPPSQSSSSYMINICSISIMTEKDIQIYNTCFRVCQIREVTVMIISIAPLCNLHIEIDKGQRKCTYAHCYYTLNLYCITKRTNRLLFNTVLVRYIAAVYMLNL